MHSLVLSGYGCHWVGTDVVVLSVNSSDFVQVQFLIFELVLFTFFAMFLSHFI